MSKYGILCQIEGFGVVRIFRNYYATGVQMIYLKGLLINNTNTAM